MDENQSIKPDERKTTQAYFLLDDDTIQVHIFGDHGWHAELRARMAEMGVICRENFCSPCG